MSPAVKVAGAWGVITQAPDGGGFVLGGITGVGVQPDSVTVAIGGTSVGDHHLAVVRAEVGRLNVIGARRGIV